MTDRATRKKSPERRIAEYVKKFRECEHRNMQQFTECCMDCGQNVYSTEQQVADYARRMYR